MRQKAAIIGKKPHNSLPQKGFEVLAIESTTPGRLDLVHLHALSGVQYLSPPPPVIK